MIFPKSSFAIAGLALALSHHAIAQTPTTQPAEAPISMDFLRHLQNKLNNVATVQGDFVQEKKLALLNHTLSIRGHFAIQKPDRLIWIVREPMRYAIRIEGDEVRQWDEDTNRVDVIHLGDDPTFQAVSQQIQAWFLGNYQSLAKDYDIVMLSQKPLSLSFVPKANTMIAKILKQVQITFAEDEQYIQSMVINEASGDTTTLKYVNTKINEPITDDAWRIPPK